MSNKYGDYQTPLSLSNKVTKLLNGDNIPYSNIIEPTFGDGSFIIASLKNIDNIKSIKGLEINQSHYLKAVNNIKYILSKNVKFNNIRFTLKNKNIFKADIKSLFNSRDHNLVIGNLPWVTVSHLSHINSNNMPKKMNIKGLSGFDALTGKSNFDISEYITLSLMNEINKLFASSTIALLVKDTVAQNILKYLPQSNIFPYSFNIYKFNAKEYFGVDVDACLMVIKFNNKHKFNNVANVYNLNNPNKLISRFGWIGDKFVSNINNYYQYSRFDRKTIWDWRSGVKHDASKVMDFIEKNGSLINGFHKIVPIEHGLVYPLVKSSDIRKENIHDSYNRYVLITQHKIGQSTKYIKRKYPKTWMYLEDNITSFLKRKSSIYKNADKFSIFGIGDYSFKPYKVAISGMYKRPFFSVLMPYDNKPAMVDDTVYFIGFSSFKDAIVFSAIMNSSVVTTLLKSLVFNSSKRPYTKSILNRIDVLSVLKYLSLADLNKFSFYKITSLDILRFKHDFHQSESISLF